MSEETANTRCDGSTLFPILQPGRLTALGRAAANAEQIDIGHDVEFRSLTSRSILNRSVSKRLQWMAWSINPYRGCEFACRYCYARYTHEFLAPSEPVRGVLADADRAIRTASSARHRDEALVPAAAEPNRATLDLRSPEAFEKRIFVKENGAWLLDQELRKLGKLGRLDEEIALGTATDPWQPIERRSLLTRSLLEVMARYSGLRLGIVTKSTLIERDIDLLQRIHERSVLAVHITITTPDVELARKLEPRAPRPDLRLQTVKRLREAGLRVGILNSPLLPGITDGPTEIDRMAALAASADASFFAAMPLFLKSCSRPTYFDFVRQHFPHLQLEYMERFRNMDFADKPYRERLETLVKASCRRYGLRERLTDNLLTRDAGEPYIQGRTAGIKKPVASEHEPMQRSLFG